jgi:outer membrane protein TolC
MYKKNLVVIISILITAVANSQSRNLDYYIEAGLKNSPLLKDYYNQADAALVDSLLIRATMMPQVEARSQLLYSPVYKNFGYDEVITDGGNYTGVVGISQNIFNKRELNNKYQSVNIQRKSLSNNTKIGLADLKRIITGQYLAAFADYNELTFNRSFLDLAYRENEIVGKFVSQGLCKQTDWLALQVETQTQEILVNQMENLYKKDLRQLNQVCGLDDSVMYQLSLPELQMPGSPDINRSPLFNQYKIDSLRIENEKAAIDARYLLKMNWFADAGFLTSNPWNFYKHFGYSAGLSLTIPIYDGRQKEQEKQKLSLAENTRGAYQNNFKIQYNQQLQQFYDELKSLRFMTAQLEKQKSTSEQLVNALRGQLETGMIQMTDYLNSVKNLRYINKNLSDSHIRIQQVINELNYLMAQ